MASDQLGEFDNVHLSGKSLLFPGKFRLASTGVAWKDRASGRIVTVSVDDIKRIQWLRAAKGFQLKFQCRNGSILKFDGFPETAYEELGRIFRQHFDMDLESKELSVRGWNWGQTEFQGNSLVFNVGNRPAFDIPLNEVSNTAMPTKNEVSLEFKVPTDEQLQLAPEARRGDQLVDIRFYIPGKATDAADHGSQEDLPDMATGENEEESAASYFLETVKTKADLGVVSGDAIVPFHELPFITPRGRYEVEMFDKFLRMHGKTYDYKIAYRNVKSLFLLPKPDEVHALFVVGLDPPVRQGQTRYPYLVMQFLRDEELEVVLSVEEDQLQTMFDGKLQKSYDGPTADIVSSIFHIMTGVELTRPPAAFKSHYGHAGIKCSIKASEGHLYPLSDGLLFLPKPALHMLFSDISQAVFSRVGPSGTSRTFDLKIALRSGGDTGFSGLDKEEYARLEQYLREKGVRVKSEGEAEGGASFKPKEEEQVFQATGEDSDEESEDEDFVAEDSSDVEEEFDEEYSSDGDDNEGKSGASDKEESDADD